MSTVILSQRRIRIGLINTSLSLPLVFFLAHLLYYFAVGDNRPWQAWVLSLGFMYLFGLPVTFVALAALGWPWLTVLARWRKLAVGYVCAGAGAIGAIIFVLVLTAFRGRWPSALDAVIEQLGTGFVLGLLSGLIFCAAARVPMRPG